MTAPDVDEFFYREAGPIWGELRGGLWHSTGSHRFRRILEAGEIRPLPDLAPHEFRWAELGTTYTRNVGAVSLFDFAEADWAWLLDDSPKAMPRTQWMTFLAAPQATTTVNEWVSTAWLAVDRSKLPNFMHWKEVEADWRAGSTARKWMPRIEACHKGPISLSACTHVLVVCAVNRQEFKRLSLDSFDSSELDTLETTWRERFAESYKFRALSGAERQKVWIGNLGELPNVHRADPGLEEKLRAARRRLDEWRANQSKGE